MWGAPWLGGKSSYRAQLRARHPSAAQPSRGSVNVHYRPSITHSLLIHLLTLRHARTHARSAHANADTP